MTMQLFKEKKKKEKKTPTLACLKEKLKLYTTTAAAAHSGENMHVKTRSQTPEWERKVKKKKKGNLAQGDSPLMTLRLAGERVTEWGGGRKAGEVHVLCTQTTKQTKEYAW